MTRNPDSTDTAAPAATLGANAIEFALASAQQVTENTDRLVRAMAGSTLASSDDADAGAQAPDWPGFTSPWAVATQLQRSSFEFGLNAWVAWMNALGSLAAATLGRGIGLTAADPRSWAPVPSPLSAKPRASASAAGRDSSASGRSRSPNATERAVAAGGARRQRPAAGPAGRSRRKPQR